MIKLKAVLGLIIFLGAICVRGEIVHVYEQTVAGGVTNRLSDTTKETGGDYVTQSAPSIAGFIFTGWTTDVKQTFGSRDALGRSSDAAPYPLYESMTLTANYLEESVDSDEDGVADGWEFYWYGDLSKDAASDTDGDGYGFAAELAAGTNPLMKDRTIIGGVVYEDSDEQLYNPHGYAPLTIRSEPAGELFATTVEYLVPGTAKAGPACDTRETSFAYWMTNGVPVRDALGRAVDSVTLVMSESAVDLVAVCVENEVERQKLYWYGTTEVSFDSDTDGDGYTLAQELAAGTNPLMKDRTIIGGVVYEDSEELEYNPNRYRKCVIRSEPEGLLFDSITSTVRAGDPITTPNCTGLDGFACWRVNGVDVRDPLGRAVDSVSILMPNHDAELVAVCVGNEEERMKLYWYGTTDVSFDSDTDGDGYTFAQELAAGTNPLMKDRTVVGGVVYEDAVTLEVNLQPFERVRGFIVNGKFMTPELAGRAIWPVVVDVNGDGVWDVVICYEGGARVFVNVGEKGTPEFEERTVDLSAVDLAMNSTEKLAAMTLDVAPVGALSVTVWGDVLLVSDAEGRIWYYKGTAVTAPVGEDADGTVSYTLQHKAWGGSFAGFANGLRIAAVDWDDDGDLDCLCGTAEGKLILLRDPKVGRPTNLYTVKFDANGGIGTMADEPMTYDVRNELTICVFTRTGYTFAGWATSADGAAKYADEATVKNLTTSSTVTLYAVWTPNSYTINFHSGLGGTGAMSDQSMTYDEEAALYANLFARTGYTFLGWTDDEGELDEVLFYNGVVVSNLTDEVDGEYDLYAVWTANAYTVKFNANGGEGTMADQAFLYDEEQALRANAFTRTGYAFAGWARDAATGMSPPQLADAEVVSNLTAEVDGVVTLYAVWNVTGLVNSSETSIDTALGEVAPYVAAATVYDGYLYDGDNIVGSVHVKVAKGKADKKTGMFSSKVTATVQLAGDSKMVSFKGGVADGSGRVTGLTAAGHTLDISLGVDGMGGTMDGKSVDGARNLFSSKDADSKSIAAAIEKKWVGAVNVVGDGIVLGVTIAKKGKVKVSGTVNGAKVSATSQLLVGEESCCVPVVITKKANLAFNLWLLADGSVEVVGLDGAVAGKAESLKSGAAFRMDYVALSRALTGLYRDYLPNGVGVTQSGTKWGVANGAKAGKLALVKGTSEIDTAKSKFTDNMSGLKLTYKAKDGSFKGSFKAYNLEKGKIKSYTVNVTGVMVGTVGYGTATIKKPACMFPIAIE